MSFADDTCIMQRSPRGLGRIMTVFVEVVCVFGRESKAKIVSMLILRAPAMQTVFNATAQTYECMDVWLSQ